MRASHESGVGLAGLHKIIRVPALTGDEAEVFLPFDGLPDERGHADTFR
jgi:hypothetical protein